LRNFKLTENKNITKFKEFKSLSLEGGKTKSFRQESVCQALTKEKVHVADAEGERRVCHKMISTRWSETKSQNAMGLAVLVLAFGMMLLSAM
jgi:uncharacterized protein YqfB (UPF0267 family)